MADDPPGAHLAHRIPRRLRVRVPSRKGDRAYFEGAVDRLRGEPSIRSVRASARTGSITIEHDGHAREVALWPASSGSSIFRRPRSPSCWPKGWRAGSLTSMPLRWCRRPCWNGRLPSGPRQRPGERRGAHLASIQRGPTLGRPGIAAVLALLGAYQMSRGRVLNPAASLFFYALMARATNGRSEARRASCRKTPRQVERGGRPASAPILPARCAHQPRRAFAGRKAAQRAPRNCNLKLRRQQTTREARLVVEFECRRPRHAPHRVARRPCAGLLRRRRRGRRGQARSCPAIERGGQRHPLRAAAAPRLAHWLRLVKPQR